jgi:hypothetical protein
MNKAREALTRAVNKAIADGAPRYVNKPAFDWKTYPNPDDIRSGCKVSWYYYRSREDAEACSVAAKHNAIRQRELGFDFGYQSPGSIEMAHPNSKYAGMWEVCLP